MKHIITIAELAIGTFIGALGAELLAIRWLRRHPPHINKRHDIEI